jgi:hypothetical protein
MKAIPTFLVLLLLKALSRLCYRFELEWVGAPPADPWRDVRILALLNHTSLYEPIYAAHVPVRVLWRIARHGVVPIADKTLDRTGPGTVFRLLAGRVVRLTRKRDETWQLLLEHWRDPCAVMVLCPEGRMLRPTGYDGDGEPMTVRGGVADLLATVGSGRMTVFYSGGLHQVAPPESRVPRLFRRVAARLESLDIAEYRGALGGTGDPDEFRRRVVADLTARRNRHCPVRYSTAPVWTAPGAVLSGEAVAEAGSAGAGPGATAGAGPGAGRGADHRDAGEQG